MQIEYSQRLAKFNSTQKYKKELEFLLKLMKPKKSDIIVDYGCGIGTAIEYFLKSSKAEYYGYDIKYLGLSKKPEWFIKDIDLIRRFNKVYFLHSFAHIQNLESVLINIKERIDLKGKIYILTPNRCFDDYFKSKSKYRNYKPDETVISHFDFDSLKEILLKVNYSVKEIGYFGEKINNKINERIYAVANVN
jgi:hypothetical protein